jgi:hypothetical protein
MAIGASTGVGWKDVFVTIFVLAIGYVIGFEVFKARFSWAIAALTCAVAADILVAVAQLKTGFYLPTYGITTLEWLASAGIAGVLTMLVPEGSDTPAPKKPLY